MAHTAASRTRSSASLQGMAAKAAHATAALVSEAGLHAGWHRPAGMVQLLSTFHPSPPCSASRPPHLSCCTSSAGQPEAMTAALCAAVLLAMLTTTYMACCFSCGRVGERQVRFVGRPCWRQRPQQRGKPPQQQQSANIGATAAAPPPLPPAPRPPHRGVSLAALQCIPHRLQQRVGAPTQHRLDVRLRAGAAGRETDIWISETCWAKGWVLEDKQGGSAAGRGCGRMPLTHAKALGSFGGAGGCSSGAGGCKRTRLHSPSLPASCRPGCAAAASPSPVLGWTGVHRGQWFGANAVTSVALLPLLSRCCPPSCCPRPALSTAKVRPGSHAPAISTSPAHPARDPPAAPPCCSTAAAPQWQP